MWSPVPSSTLYSSMCALPAFWAGLLYHAPSLDAAWDLAGGWTMDERLKLRQDAPRLGLKAEIRGRSLQSVALELLDLAREGLASRQRLNASGDNESGFLSPLQETAESGITPAERKLRMYESDWEGSVDPVFAECAY